MFCPRTSPEASPHTSPQAFSRKVLNGSKRRLELKERGSPLNFRPRHVHFWKQTLFPMDVTSHGRHSPTQLLSTGCFCPSRRYHLVSRQRWTYFPWAWRKRTLKPILTANSAFLGGLANLDWMIPELRFPWVWSSKFSRCIRVTETQFICTVSVKVTREAFIKLLIQFAKPTNIIQFLGPPFFQIWHKMLFITCDF